MDNIGKLLKDNDLKWTDILRMRVLPVNFLDINVIFEVLKDYLGEDLKTWPPLTYMSLVGLPRPQALVEIECEVLSLREWKDCVIIININT